MGAYVVPLLYLRGHWVDLRGSVGFIITRLSMLKPTLNVAKISSLLLLTVKYCLCNALAHPTDTWQGLELLKSISKYIGINFPQL